MAFPWSSGITASMDFLLVESLWVKVTSPGFNRLKNSRNFCWSLKSQKILPKSPWFGKTPFSKKGSFFHLAGEVRLHVLAQAVNSCWFLGSPMAIWVVGGLLGRNQSCPFRWPGLVNSHSYGKSPFLMGKKSVHHALKSWSCKCCLDTSVNTSRSLFKLP